MKRAALIALAVLPAFLATARGQDAKQILDATGVKGGLVVVIGCDGPALLAGLRPNDSYLVHGLDTDAAKVRQARQHIQSLGAYGKVSADCFGGKRLPYVRDLVNLLLAGDRLFAAGPPDVVEQGDPYAAFEGRKGAVLQVFSAADGALLEAHPLASPPVFDGMSAARGRLYLSAKGARIVCFAARQK